MSDHQRDIFMWRWSRDRVGGFVRALVRGVLFGGLCGLLWANAQGGASAGLANPSLWVVPLVVTSFGLEFVSSRFWRDAASVLIFGALLALVLAARNFDVSWRVAIYVGIGTFIGAALAARSFKRDEARFQGLLSQGVAVPERRPMPGWSDFRAPGVVVLLLLAAFGPIYLLSLFEPH